MLKTLREEKGFTQVGLAKKARVERTYITKLETGGKENPSLATLQRLAKALGVPVTKLLG